MAARLTRRSLAGAALGATLITLGAGLWLVAPALSIRPYVPKPVDFELRDGSVRKESLHARAAVYGLHRPMVLRSPVLDTRKRFNLVGLRWRGARASALRIRVRKTGRPWSRWVAVPVDPDHAPDLGSNERRGRWKTSDPLWAGDADQVQYRLTTGGPVRDLRLHFVNTKGTATTLDRLRTRARRLASGAVAAVGALFSARASAADTSQPEIVTRDQWGASSCPPRATPQYGEVKLAFIHHTVTANDYAPGDSAAMVRAVCRYHRNSNGWNDIGYQFIVDKYGKIFEGRAGGIDQAVVGAQAQGYNTESTGIANLGTFSTVGQTEQGLAALARLLSWKLALHGVPPEGKVSVRSTGGALNRYPAGAGVVLDRISGHRDADSTACPGDALYAQLPRLRAMVSGDTRGTTAVGFKAARAHIPYGRKARLSGSLTAAGGGDLGGRRVRIQSLGGASGSRTLTQVGTDSRGSFSTTVRLSFNRTLSAQFGGDLSLRPAQSPPVSIGIRPRVTAALSESTAVLQTGQRVLVSGSVRPRKAAALLLIDRETARGSLRRIAKKKVRARLGKIRLRHSFASPGTYRLRLGVDADARNLSARSQPIQVKVTP